MLTGTPLDLTPFGAVLGAVGVLIWILVALALWWALRGKRVWWNKALRALPIVLLVLYGPVRSGWESYRFQQRLQASVDLWKERCKSAGEKINRTVENQEGIVWMRWRRSIIGQYSDQFALSDPYGHDCSDEECIRKLLRVSTGLDLDPTESLKRWTQPPYIGYRFVETLDPRDGKLYRYTLSVRALEQSSPTTELKRTEISSFTAVYGLTWEDVSTREDREHWIAGGELRVVHVQTGDLLAKRIGYMMDRGLGSEAGFRMPWGEAVYNACPPFESRREGSRRLRTFVEDRDFVVKVAEPVQG